MNAIKQKMVDICRINIEDDEMWIQLARERKEDGLLARALADKKANEERLAELLNENG